MAVKKQARTNSARKSVATTEPGHESDDENVDKIRDILFGNQLRDFNNRFAQLEKRLATDIELLRSESAQQIESMRTYVEGEIDLLDNRLKTEETTRVEQLDELDDDLKKTGRQLEKKLADAASYQDKQSSAIKEQLLKNSQDFQQQLSDQIQQVRRLMDDNQHLLSDTKMDRTLLAELLHGMASQLNQDEK